MIVSDLFHESGDFTDGLAQVVNLHVWERKVGRTLRTHLCIYNTCSYNIEYFSALTGLSSTVYAIRPPRQNWS